MVAYCENRWMPTTSKIKERNRRQLVQYVVSVIEVLYHYVDLQPTTLIILPSANSSFVAWHY
jgi:hypothetical protein